MPPLSRPLTALRTFRLTSSSPLTLTSSSTQLAPIASTSLRALSNTSARKATHAPAGEHAADHSHDDHGHESHYDPPGGWLWGIKPGEKQEKEGWENIWIYGFFGGTAVAAVAFAFKPDTSIQTWALEEARRRLEAEGILAEPEDKP